MNKKEKREYFKKMGSKGGKATASKKGKAYMHRLAVKAAEARWGSKDVREERKLKDRIARLQHLAEKHIISASEFREEADKLIDKLRSL